MEGKPAEQAEKSAGAQRDIAKQFLDTSTQLKKIGLPQYQLAANVLESAVKGGPELLKMAPVAQTADEYQNAVRAIRERPPGGTQDLALQMAESQYRSDRNKILNDTYQKALAYMMQSAQATTGGSLNALAGASGSEQAAGSLFQRMAEAKDQNTGAAAQGAGQLLSTIVLTGAMAGKGKSA